MDPHRPQCPQPPGGPLLVLRVISSEWGYGILSVGSLLPPGLLTPDFGISEVLSNSTMERIFSNGYCITSLMDGLEHAQGFG